MVGILAPKGQARTRNKSVRAGPPAGLALLPPPLSDEKERRTAAVLGSMSKQEPCQLRRGTTFTPGAVRSTRRISFRPATVLLQKGQPLRRVTQQSREL